MKRLLISNLLGLVGAAIGGVLGFYTFGWLEDTGSTDWRFPGPSSGSAAACWRSTARPSAGSSAASRRWDCRLFTEWKFHPFLADDSFIVHAHASDET